jgi:hypothetical protein
MLYALNWFFILALVALWSLAAWALHAVSVWTVSNAGALSGGASGAVTLALPEWLAPWLPPEIAQWTGQALQAFAPLIDSLLQSAPALAAGLTVATWVIWAIGSGLLVLLGAALHLLIALMRRRRGGDAGPNAGSSLAAS